MKKLSILTIVLILFCLTCSCTQATYPDELILYYPFEEESGATIVDAGVYGNDGAFSGTATWVTGQDGSALEFTPNDYVNVTRTSDLDIGTNDFSVFTWIKTSNTTAVILIKRAWVVPTNPGFQLQIIGGVLVATLCDGTATRLQLTSTLNVADNTWHFVGFTADRDGNLRIYKDTASETFDISSQQGDMSNTENIYLGRDYPSGAGGSQFVGYMDDLRVYNTALSSGEVSAIYNFNQPTITITQPFNRTYTSGVIPVTISGAGDLIYFNVKNGSSWVYDSNTTYTASTTLTGFTNGTYTFYGFAVISGVGTESSTVVFTVETPISSSLPAVNTDAFWLFYYEGDFLGAFQAAFISTFVSVDAAVAVIIMLFMLPLYLRTKSLLLLSIVWILIGGFLIAAVPMASGVAVLFIILAVGGLFYRLFKGGN